MALLLSLFNTAYNIAQHNKLQGLNYLSRAVQYRPQLEVTIKDDFSGILRLDAETQGGRVVTDTAKLTLVMNNEVQMKNTGNSIATVLCYGGLDRYTGDSVIRDSLLDKNQQQRVISQLSSDFFPTIQLLPGEVASVTIPVEVNDFNKEKNEFAAHYIILYKNEVGCLFDSYYWRRMKASPFTFKNRKGGGFNVSGTLEEVEMHHDFKIYNISEAKTVADLMLRKLGANK